MIDDNTDGERLWRPVADWSSHGVKFAHLQDWPGHKSGALNYALRNLTDPHAELIGVVDSDYQLLPEFLARYTPLFADPGVGFIQAPQDYRDSPTPAPTTGTPPATSPSVARPPTTSTPATSVPPTSAPATSSHTANQQDVPSASSPASNQPIR